MTATLSSSLRPAQQDSSLQLRNIIQSLPKDCFEQDAFQAWKGAMPRLLSLLGFCFPWLGF
jgi:hypothetical protein